MPTAKLKDNAIAMPDEVLDELGLEEGDAFEILIQDDVIVLKLQETCGELAKRHPEIDAALEEGLHDIAEGRVSPAFASVEEMKAYLKNKS
ncbi:MAG: AbrB/MazE/SpoVT family DNA-binding domain-containing protein [Deinococcota bacterium]|jgi:bifunctional DNA-binding transcriptional regulator/antitoxin component of YhaV-PrlF toxin-antitoxin module|nr:AbrB/MazE/SpoVT family DNA-binding domain-containing protein [Deinococcota bacterium]